MLKPLVDDDGAPYFEYAAKGELRMQTCANCGEVLFPPRPMCPRCQGIEFEWKLMSGRGHVWSFAVPRPPLLPDYAALAPYPVVVVELEEDRRLRLVGNLVAVRADAGASTRSTRRPIEIGQPVRAVFREIEGLFVAAWTPDDDVIRSDLIQYPPVRGAGRRRLGDAEPPGAAQRLRSDDGRRIPQAVENVAAPGLGALRRADRQRRQGFLHRDRPGRRGAAAVVAVHGRRPRRRARARRPPTCGSRSSPRSTAWPAAGPSTCSASASS